MPKANITTDFLIVAHTMPVKGNPETTVVGRNSGTGDIDVVKVFSAGTAKSIYESVNCNTPKYPMETTNVDMFQANFTPKNNFGPAVLAIFRFDGKEFKVVEALIGPPAIALHRRLTGVD